MYFSSISFFYSSEKSIVFCKYSTDYSSLHICFSLVKHYNILYKKYIFYSCILDIWTCHCNQYNWVNLPLKGIYDDDHVEFCIGRTIVIECLWIRVLWPKANIIRIVNIWILKEKKFCKTFTKKIHGISVIYRAAK